MRTLRVWLVGVGLFSGLYLEVNAEKPMIDGRACSSWSFVGNPQISNDGAYVSYRICRSGPVADDLDHVASTTLVFCATGSDWRRDFPGFPDRGPSAVSFTAGGKFAVFLKPENILEIVGLGKQTVEDVPKVAAFAVPSGGSGEWLSYQAAFPAHELSLRDLKSGATRKIPDVEDASFRDDGKVLLLKTKVAIGTIVTESLCWMDVGSGEQKVIWSGPKLVSYTFDKSGTRVALLTERLVEGTPVRSLWTFEEGVEKAVKRADTVSLGMGGNERLTALGGFSADGERLMIMIGQGSTPGEKAKVANEGTPTVWSYKDTKLQSEQQRELNGAGPIAGSDLEAAADLATGRLIRISQPGDEPVAVAYFGEGGFMADDSVILMHHREGEVGHGEERWNPAFREAFYIVSAKTGARTRLPGRPSRFVSLSPEARYVIDYDLVNTCFYSVDVSTGTIRNLTGEIPGEWTEPDSGSMVPAEQGKYPRHTIVTGWLESDRAVLIGDRYDIWQIDPSGAKAPINLTNGYGKAHHTEFSILPRFARSALSHGSPVVVSGFDKDTKDNGFYRITLDRSADPEILNAGAYFSFMNYADIGFGPDVPPIMEPLKARAADAYVVQRMTASESPNYYYTSDFKTFRQLSDVHPERNYNWLTTELMTWTAPGGRSLQGILFKPENFDPGRKYPVIIHYYESKSDLLNVFIKPLPCNGPLNIPTFVSNGYLVFTPDIHYRPGDVDEAAVDSVVSAGEMLAKLPYVDGKRMGIMGHSFGAIETNFIVTRTGLFAAACSASSLWDYVSAYGELRTGWGESSMFEYGQNRMGATLWEQPNLYLRQSAVLHADRVTTPLLMMETTDDSACPFRNALEGFLGLRRLGKKVWMLQYDKESHVLRRLKDAEDFTRRLTQFFDYYLKGALPPKWMTEGIPARLKGIDTGLEFDTSGAVP